MNIFREANSGLNRPAGEQGSSVRVLLIRPGATDFDEQGRITGTLDIPLSPLGQRQAKQLCEKSLDFELKAIYSSPSLAAQQTAGVLSARWGRKFKVTEKLRNIDHGLWQGKEIEELRSTQPRIARQWKEHPETVCPPCGESVEDVIPRIVKLLKRLVKKHKSGTIVIVVADPLANVISSLLTCSTPSHVPMDKEDVANIKPFETETGLTECGRMEILELQAATLAGVAEAR